MPLVEWIELAEHKNDSGRLVIAEAEKNVPFAIRRVYCLLDLDIAKRRGFHAHRELQQLAVCVRGSCCFLLDDGREAKEIMLNQPQRGLMIRPMVWHEMFDFSEDCMLMVFASEHYDENDYIRDYGEFKNAVQ